MQNYTGTEPQTRSRSASNVFRNVRFPVRYVVLALILISTAVEYICRYNINVSMVAMVKERNHSEHKPENHTGSWGCPVPEEKVNATHLSGTYDWDAKTQGVILGAFFYTYTVMQIPSGRIAEEFGGRWVVSFSLLGSGILNILTPFLTFSVVVMVLSRLVLGVLQGGLFPACFSIIFNWFPLKERALGYSIMEIGTMIGSITAMAMAGYLAEHGFGGGWPSTFYISGIVAVLAAIIWTPYVTSTPEEHWMVSTTEMKTIRKESGAGGDVEELVRERKKKRKRPVPWKAIFTNKAVMANVWAKFFLRWTFYTLVMKLPAYLNDVLHMSKTKNGLVNGAMYLVSIIPMLTIGYFSESLIEKGILTRTQTRKTFVTIACLGAALCLAVIPSMGCNQNAVIAILFIGGLFQAFDAAGNVPNPGELSKNYATTVFAIVNMLNTSAGFIVPYLIGVILESRKGMDPIQTWSIVFYLASGIAICGAVIYLLFGSGDRQKFDYDVEPEEEEEEDRDLLSEGEEGITDQLLEQHSPVRRLTTN